jgi:hypothetical protein
MSDLNLCGEVDDPPKELQQVFPKRQPHYLSNDLTTISMT